MHLRQTQQHIHNLDQCFSLLGTQPPNVDCEAVKGLKKEHETFKKENPPEDILTMFDLGAALKTEHYEIASYTGLIGMARLMGQTQVVNLLEQNLNQEKEMAQKAEQLSRQLGQRLAGPPPQSRAGQQPTA
jgi:ferritin-like metal-binding protein YciE